MTLTKTLPQRAVMLLLSMAASISFNSQIIGGSEAGQLIPQEVKASDLSAGAYQGDVSLFDGSYNATYPLGSVSTLNGIRFDLNLSYSPSFTSGISPSPVDGVPYGLGWNLSLPRVTVSSDSYHKYQYANHCGSGTSSSQLQQWETDTQIEKNETYQEGSSYWFAPTISIPGVASGRAVFKYVDKNTDRAVFGLHGFERSVDIYWDNGSWRIELDDGTYYQMDIAKASIRNGSNERGFDPLQIYQYAYGAHGADDLELGAYRDGLMGMIMPHYEFTEWYCSEIGNLNHPGETVHFEYDRYGAFDYFHDLRHDVNQLSAEDFFSPHDGDTVNVGGACQNFVLGRVSLEIAPTYNDLHLKRVYSVQGAIREEILLNYGTEMDFSGHLLDFRDDDVFRKDSLYSYKTVYRQGVSGAPFEKWNRYYHWKSNSLAEHSDFSQVDSWLEAHEEGMAYTAGASLKSGLLTDPKNPYVGTVPSIAHQNQLFGSSYDDMVVGNGQSTRFYARTAAYPQETQQLSFDHGFLESPRLNSYTMGVEDYVPGSTYELRTKYSGDYAFIDINLVTGNKANNYQSSFDDPSHPGYKNFISDTPSGYNSASAYRASRGESIFSTFGNAIKWHSSSDPLNPSSSLHPPLSPREYPFLQRDTRLL